MVVTQHNSYFPKYKIFWINTRVLPWSFLACVEQLAIWITWCTLPTGSSRGSDIVANVLYRIYLAPCCLCWQFSIRLSPKLPYLEFPNPPFPLHLIPDEAQWTSSVRPQPDAQDCPYFFTLKIQILRHWDMLIHMPGGWGGRQKVEL